MFKSGFAVVARMALALSLACAAPSMATAQVTSVSISGTDVSCNGGSNGTATARPTGGSGTYTYLWNTGAAQQSITGLSAGRYVVSVGDPGSPGSPRVEKEGFVLQPAALTASGSSTPTRSGAATGSATVDVAGGNGGYLYSWAPTGGTAATATGLSEGTYTVTVTDANLCQISRSVIVAAALAPTVVLAPPLLPNGAAGSAYSQTLTASGGAAPYVFRSSGVLPAGLTLSAGGVLSGTPSAAGTTTFTVIATDNDAFEGQRTYSVTIAPAPVPVPTLSEWAMILFTTILAGFGALWIQRRRLTA